MVDALNASAEDFAEARRRRKEFTTPQRRLFRMLDHEYGRTVRDELLGNANLRSAGVAHDEAQRGRVRQEEHRLANNKKAQSLARKAGFSSASFKNSERAVRELDGIAELRSKLSQKASTNE